MEREADKTARVILVSSDTVYARLLGIHLAIEQRCADFMHVRNSYDLFEHLNIFADFPRLLIVPRTLVVLDVRRPDRGEYDVISLMKLHPTTKHIPILTISDTNWTKADSDFHPDADIGPRPQGAQGFRELISVAFALLDSGAGVAFGARQKDCSSTSF